MNKSTPQSRMADSSINQTHSEANTIEQLPVTE